MYGASEQAVLVQYVLPVRVFVCRRHQPQHRQAAAILRHDCWLLHVQMCNKEVIGILTGSRIPGRKNPELQILQHQRCKAWFHKLESNRGERGVSLSQEIAGNGQACSPWGGSTTPSEQGSSPERPRRPKTKTISNIQHPELLTIT